MQALQPGQNDLLGDRCIVMGIAGEPHEDFAAQTQAGLVLLTAEGRARDFADLISAEQPRSGDGAVRFAEPSGEFRIDLEAVPATIARMALVLTIRPSAAPGVTFGVFASIRAWLTDAAGAPRLVFPLPTASRGETVMIVAELYRRQGRWKFRAVGQGFAAGLPALAAHFGLPLPKMEPPAAGTAPRRTGESPPQTTFSGTGFCIHADGYVLTNHHVIDGAQEILARTPRQRCILEPVFADPTNDLALLRATTPLAGVAAFREGPPARLGDAVVVVGYPLGGLLGSGPQVTTGNVSALIGPGDDTRALQFTAPIQAGNSGGPLLDSEGRVVGVVTAKLNAARIHEMTGDIPQNVNFAIKAALARVFLEAAGVHYQNRSASVARAAADIAAEACDFVVKIECRGRASGE